MRKETIRIPYPGSCISVNHYLVRGRRTFVRPEAKNFQQELGWMIKHLHIEDWKFPIEVKCSGYFKDERSACDLSNLSKCVLDAIQGVIGHNDKDFRWRDGNRVIGEKDPYLLITIQEANK